MVLTFEYSRESLILTNREPDVYEFSRVVLLFGKISAAMEAQVGSQEDA